MEPQEIIASGILEMYVAGALPENETLEVAQAIETHPEVKREVEIIEESLKHLAENVAPPQQAMVWTNILNSIKKIKNLDQDNTKTWNWPAITGWAAAILFMGGIMWMLNQNNKLNNSLQILTTENVTLKEEKTIVESELAENNKILKVVRSRDYQAWCTLTNRLPRPWLSTPILMPTQTGSWNSSARCNNTPMRQALQVRLTALTWAGC